MFFIVLAGELMVVQCLGSFEDDRGAMFFMVWVGELMVVKCSAVSK